MKTLLINFLSVIALSCLFGQTDWQQKSILYYPIVLNSIEKEGYELVFNDEFNTTTFDYGKWTRENYFHGSEKQIYVDDLHHDAINSNYELTGSVIKLIARNESPPTTMNQCIDLDNDDIPDRCAQDYEYTSAMFYSNEMFKYGYFEIRCKLPKGESLFPAFWLYIKQGNFKDQGNEIDIMEANGTEFYHYSTNFHWVQDQPCPWDNKEDDNWGYSCGKNFWPRISTSGYAPDLSEDFYTYGLEWSANRIDFYLNNKLVRSVKDYCEIPDCFMKIITNLAISPIHNTPNNIFPAEMEVDYIRVYKKKWCQDFCYDQGWRSSSNRRMLGDINGDGKDDIVGFGGSKVYVSLSYEDTQGKGYRYPSAVLSDFCYAQGWRVNDHDIYLADVNGDGAKDIVGFGNEGVKVALGVKVADYQTPRFTVPKIYISDFNNNNGWNKTNHRRMVADVNGDGKDDIVCFGASKVFVALAKVDANGFGFRWHYPVLDDFCSSDGYSISNHVVNLSDVNGDGAADIIGFGEEGVKVALGVKVANNQTPKFGTPKLYISGFGSNQGWNTTNHRRMVADVNGDGKDDIVCFGTSKVYVALSKVDANGFGFRWPESWCNDFCHSQGWRTDQHPIYLSDINGDGRNDIVGFSGAGVQVALAYEDNNGPGFRWPELWLNEYGYSDGYRVDRHPRMLGNIDDDKSTDVIAFSDDAVFVTLSPNCSSSRSLKSKVIDDEELSVHESSSEPALRIYPNPSNGIFYLEHNSGESPKSISVYNSHGQKIYERENPENFINMEDIIKGYYIAKISYDNKIITKKIILN